MGAVDVGIGQGVVGGLEQVGEVLLVASDPAVCADQRGDLAVVGQQRAGPGRRFQHVEDQAGVVGERVW